MHTAIQLYHMLRAEWAYSELFARCAFIHIYIVQIYFRNCGAKSHIFLTTLITSLFTRDLVHPKASFGAASHQRPQITELVLLCGTKSGGSEFRSMSTIPLTVCVPLSGPLWQHCTMSTTSSSDVGLKQMYVLVPPQGLHPAYSCIFCVPPRTPKKIMWWPKSKIIFYTPVHYNHQYKLIWIFSDASTAPHLSEY